MTLKQTADFLKSRDDFLILTHRSPDGDTLGSAAGLCRGLRALGKTAHVAPNAEVGDRFRPLVSPLFPKRDGGGFETVVIVDTATAQLIPKSLKEYESAIELAIDHHPGGGQYAPHYLTDDTCAAVGELIFLLLTELGVELTPEIAEPLYVAIATDTGCLRYENVTSRTLRVAAELKDTGLATAPINTELFEKKTFSRLALEAALLQDVELLRGGRVAVMRLTREKIEYTDASDDDVDGISPLARQITGVEVGVLLREEEPDDNGQPITRVSVRTGPEFDAGATCAKLGGGGHKRAAGCVLGADLDYARDLVLNAI
ncbi:phosphoesterase RecJ-like protein [Clostridia bacterium]|nr:phosphoesterase RecJ-like protein [Clostridia bacterium]